MDTQKMTIRLKVNPSRLPVPQLKRSVKNVKPEDAAPVKRDWSRVRRGINSGNKGRPPTWTKEMDSILKELKEKEGMTWNEVADEMGRTRESVRSRYYEIRQ